MHTADNIEPPDPAERRTYRPRPRPDRPSGLLAGMRIRKKLMFLHTVFWLVLAAVLLLALRPALTRVVEEAELAKATFALQLLATEGEQGLQTDRLARITDRVPDVVVSAGTASSLGLSPELASRAMAHRGISHPVGADAGGARAVLATPDAGDAETVFVLAEARIPGARDGVRRLYTLMIVALLGVYGLVVIALEALVLPRHVYGPIRRVLRADEAVRNGRKDEELIPDPLIPADELGEIMRSRNASIRELRSHEKALAEALNKLESVATDLKRKNHLLEAAKKNLADADRLASLGMMSAGIAHELNTPLTVLKGLVERLNRNPQAGLPPDQTALMLRVVERLEALGDSLLDFARVRPPSTNPVPIRNVVDEAATLVTLDREAAGVTIHNAIPDQIVVECDEDRMVQVFVNLLRNAADAIIAHEHPQGDGHIRVEAFESDRDEARWITVTVTDNGPGIDADVLSSLFEPFVSTRLDARGTGLGLAVAEGIVREHGGVILARNRADRAGSVFEIMLPARASGSQDNPEGPVGQPKPAQPDNPESGSIDADPPESPEHPE